MKSSAHLARKLRSLLFTTIVVEIDRSPISEDKYWGFVVGLSERFVLLNVVDNNYLLDGFALLRLQDIGHIRVVGDRGDLIRYVLSKRYPQGYPNVPAIDMNRVDDFSFLETIHEVYPLVTILRSAINDQVCRIGRVQGLKPKTFTLHTIDPDAEWSDVGRFRYEDVTSLNFGGKYEEGLWVYSEYVRRREEGKEEPFEPPAKTRTRSNDFVRNLQSLASTNRLIRIDRSPLTKKILQGFVVDANEQFLTLSLVDDSFFLDGFAIVRMEDLKGYWLIEDKEEMIRYILRQRYPEGYLRRPKVELEIVDDFLFLEKIHEAYPLVAIFREEIREHTFSLGRVQALRPNTFRICLLEPDGEWKKVGQFRYDDVTQIAFGGLYEDALRMYAEHLEKETHRLPD